MLGFVPCLDSAITLTELQSALKSCKRNKTPGIDLIANEFYTNLTPAWEHYLLNLFNQILTHEVVPREWSAMELRILHKKGNPSDPGKL